MRSNCNAHANTFVWGFFCTILSETSLILFCFVFSYFCRVLKNIMLINSCLPRQVLSLLMNIMFSIILIWLLCFPELDVVLSVTRTLEH